MDIETELLKVGRPVPDGWRSLSAAVHRGSTVLFDSFDGFVGRADRLAHGYSYGQNGSPTTYELANWIAALEGGGYTVLVPTGLAATVLVAAATLRAGDKVLVPDCIYAPTLEALQKLFARWGVVPSTYDGSIGGNIATLLAPEVKLVWVEAPGSNTLDMQDVPAITAACQRGNVMVAMDNTWATPLGFRPLDNGVTFSVQALTKYVGGHSDLLMGSVTVREEQTYLLLRERAELLGYYVSPDECALALRGAGTMALRLERHAESALKVARWLSSHPAVEVTNYPPLPGSAGHEIWRRDFRSAAGVLSFKLRNSGRAVTKRFVEELQLFRLGASWGGIHSLVAPLPDRKLDGSYLIRLHVGLENVDDLVADLEKALEVATQVNSRL